jgi:hypothetical protein
MVFCMAMNWKEPESVDLGRVTQRLHDLFQHDPLLGYLHGKTAMRNALEDTFQISELDAEELLDTMESRGFIHFDGDPTSESEVEASWEIEMHRRE